MWENLGEVVAVRAVNWTTSHARRGRHSSACCGRHEVAHRCCYQHVTRAAHSCWFSPVQSCSSTPRHLKFISWTAFCPHLPTPAVPASSHLSHVMHDIRWPVFLFLRHGFWHIPTFLRHGAHDAVARSPLAWCVFLQVVFEAMFLLCLVVEWSFRL